MKEIIIDSDMITTNFSSSGYNVKQILYYDSRRRRKDNIYIPANVHEEFGVKFNSNTACFAGVSTELRSYIKINPYDKVNRYKLPLPNRIYYYMASTGGRPKPTKSAEYAWIRMCKKHNLLPTYVKPSTVAKRRVVFDTSETSPSLLYIYLSMMRAVVEYPTFVRAMVYLVDKLKINFYAAFVFASKIYIGNSGHHIINVYREYINGIETIKNMSTIELRLMMALRRYSDNPTKFDNRPFTSLYQSSWNCNTTIDKAKGLNAQLKINDLFSPNLEKIIMSNTDKEAQHYFEELKKDKKVKITLKKLNIEKARKKNEQL